MGAFWALLIRLHAFVGPVLTMLYPVCASIQAIESPTKEDDEQWLTYWILYSFMTLFELVAAPALAWFPLWYPLKLAFVCWLVLPQFKGASFVYDQLVRKYVVRSDSPVKQKLNSVLNSETINNVEKFINENGQEAFDKLLSGTNAQRGGISSPVEEESVVDKNLGKLD